MAKSKSVNLQVTIGGLNLTNKCVKSFEMERNFSDVANKFTLVIIDSPKQTTTDLELFMNAGYRTIIVSYNDTSEQSGFLKFTGTIWDYTNTFVGNIKQLTVTGYLTKSHGSDSIGEALYNIDWNAYYHTRISPTARWNVYAQVEFAEAKLKSWESANLNVPDTKRSLYNSNTVYQEFRNYYMYNSIKVKVQGPGGSIELPVPDSFWEMNTTETQTKLEDGTEITIPSDLSDPNGRFWGKLELVPLVYIDPISKHTIQDGTTGLYRVADSSSKYNGQFRGFKDKVTGKSFVQMNPEKDYYGAGTFVYSTVGVDPSYIVKQLAKLEGWKYNDTTIVQTEMVPCSDKFKMKNQSALEFINDVLVPVSVTPAGLYTDKKGNSVSLAENIGGFTAYFDSNNVFHYEPLNTSRMKDKRDVKLGYNVPDSPVLSFQVETKGTAFYTTNPAVINSMSIVTGQPINEIVVNASTAQLDEYNKVAGHNENLDAYFGYTYEEVQKMYENAGATFDAKQKGYWIGFRGSNLSDDSLTKLFLQYHDTKSTTDQVCINVMSKDGKLEVKPVTELTDPNAVISSSALTKKLVNKYYSSATTSSKVAANELQNARTKIEEFMITASLNMWGDTRIAPACIIRLTNMVKSTTDIVQKHPTSGEYLVLKQTDSISGDNFIQKLSLLRNKTSLSSGIDKYNIDWSKRATESLIVPQAGSPYFVGPIKDPSAYPQNKVDEETPVEETQSGIVNWAPIVEDGRVYTQPSQSNPAYQQAQAWTHNQYNSPNTSSNSGYDQATAWKKSPSDSTTSSSTNTFVGPVKP